MTEENYYYRTSPFFLRNEFHGEGKLQIPIIPKFKPQPDDFDSLLLIGFDKARAEDFTHNNRMLHFFLYDYKFESVWNQPEKYLDRLQNYRAVLSPDFSMYIEMAPVMQLYNTFRNRWCGAYWASKGIRVIPTVNWGDESTFDFCFQGIEKGSVVAVSTYMASEHGNRQDQKDWFLAGYNEMLLRIEPEKIICYNTPFPEMQGDIVPIDYELSSWKYMGYKPELQAADLDAFKIGGAACTNCDTIEPYLDVFKGGGSAWGGAWQPAKVEDERLLGKPGETKVTYDKYGDRRETKIGEDGRAVMERHHTDHSNPKHHSDPHDHIIDWNRPNPGIPNFSQRNYWDGNIPEFKLYGRKDMNTTYHNLRNSPEENRFKTISEFKWSLSCGAEVAFTWKGISYFIGDPSAVFPDKTYYIAPRSEFTDVADTKYCDTPDEVLEYIVSGDRLRDVITQVEVDFRLI